MTPLPPPEALLFDVDGVLADVRPSYRRAIIETAAHFGVSVTPADIAAVKAEGDANNDWVVTWRLMERRGVTVQMDGVVDRFEALYQGGLWREERLLFPREALRRLAARLPLGLVTGRPRGDLERFLDQFELRELFGASVCMHETPLPKPDPAPVRRCLGLLGVASGWMLGDTPDDVRAALGAGVVALGVVAPGEDTGSALRAAGAARVVALDELEEMIP